MDNQELANKIAELKGKCEFLKAQQADIESKKKKLIDEMNALGFTSLDELKAALKKVTEEAVALESALGKSIKSVEIQAMGLEARAKGEPSSVGSVTKPKTEETL